MTDQSLRGFLHLVETEFPADFVRISNPVRRELDITSCVFEFERHGKSPVLLFEDIEGFNGSVVTNTAGNRRLLAAAGLQGRRQRRRRRARKGGCRRRHRRPPRSKTSRMVRWVRSALASPCLGEPAL